MDSSLKQSNSFSRVSSIDVSQLDKINAIPNKSSNNVLMDGLCIEDQHYIMTLMENDSSDSNDDNNEKDRRSSAWGPPMIQSPVIMNKRMKKLRPTYAITLSLEDISYIRPSWGISKGIRTIEINKKPKNSDGKVKKEIVEKSVGKGETGLRYFLIFLTLIIVSLTVAIYLIDRKRERTKIDLHRIQLNKAQGLLEIFRQETELLDPAVVVQIAHGIPRNLKPSDCTCKLFTDELRRHNNRSYIGETDSKTCISCLDWASRANLRVYSEKRKDSNSHCYDLQWQSYDSLLTPLINCFIIKDEQWFGIGDVQAQIWPLDKLEFDWTPVATNLSVEFVHETQTQNQFGRSLPLGSYANLSILTTNGIHIGNLNTDFKVSLKISYDAKLGHKRLCLSASCGDGCGQIWPQTHDVDRFRYRNNILEYTICSSETLRDAMTKLTSERTNELTQTVTKSLQKQEFITNERPIDISHRSERLLEREFVQDSNGLGSSKLGIEPPPSEEDKKSLPDGIGLIERTIFVTSQEFMSTLDGQTLRQYVDSIVKLNLGTSSILVIDSRWETYVGSLKLNTVLFPKAKLLFEILHNKGFKILFTLKPYVDTAIGVGNINQLLAAGRLYSTKYNEGVEPEKIQGGRRWNKSIAETIIRRQSFFLFVNESIEIESNVNFKTPYLHRCKESRESYCVLLDLSQDSNRVWFINNIKRSSILSLGADGIVLGGTHPNNFFWDDHYRSGVSEFSKSLFYNEKLYVLPQWTGDFGYIQLAPRTCSWDSLKSIVSSVMNLNMMGFSLVHPGSVWGDLKTIETKNGSEISGTDSLGPVYRNAGLLEERASEELIIRWLQVSIFLPVLQFNNIAPIEEYGIQDLVQNLVKIRKTQIVPELKKHLPYTPLVRQSKGDLEKIRLPLIRPVLYGQAPEETVITEQFMIGSDILVAPVLSEGLRQRDIYLPSGFWRDELRQVNVRGGKWLRNYPVELIEVAWFTRARR